MSVQIVDHEAMPVLPGFTQMGMVGRKIVVAMQQPLGIIDGPEPSPDSAISASVTRAATVPPRVISTPASG